MASVLEAQREAATAIRNSVLLADWPAPAGVVGLTTLRGPWGDSRPPFDRFNLGQPRDDQGDDPATVAANRRALERGLDLPGPPRWLRQVHGTRVVVEPGLDTPEADAAVTAVPGRVLAVLSADCLPVILGSGDAGEVAVAHAGWRGLAAGVLEATVAAMASPAPTLHAWLGPAAGPAFYEVGQEVREAFVSLDAAAGSAFRATRPGHWHVDLYRLARDRLASAGVLSGRICGGGLCTISDAASFFSHRRDGRTGRMATLAWIEPDTLRRGPGS